MCIFAGLPVGIVAHISRVFPVIHTAGMFILGHGWMMIVPMIVAAREDAPG
jgi:hypothetical protein